MSLTDNISQSEAMLGFHDPTFEVGAYTRGQAGGAAEGDRAGEGFFATLLDVINPLQHIPLVSTLYREITGDEISPSARILGGGLFGGPIGLASASANVILEQASGDDLMGHALAMVSGETEPAIAPQQASPVNGASVIHEQADAGERTNTDIILAGPPALASVRAAPISLAPPATQAAPVMPAPPPLSAELAAPAVPKVVKSVVIDQTINNEPQKPAAPAPDTGTTASALPANWVNEALRDAATMKQALQNGAAPEAGEPKPWVGNAILDALSKYEALTRARAQSGPS